MTRTRNRNAWIWVALAALTLASVSRAEPGTQSPRTFAHPVLQFLGSHLAQPSLLNTGSSAAQDRSSRQLRMDRRSAWDGAWLAMLPVFFIGLVSPLNQLLQRSILRSARVPAAPLLPAAFQRPPPLQFA